MMRLVWLVLLILGTALTAAEENESPITLTSVQKTSLLVAYWRQLETRRSSMKDAPTPSLIEDEFAMILIDKLATDDLLQSFKSSPMLAIGINIMAIRTRIIDDWLVARANSTRQVVNLGAGMCTRPYRLDFGNSTVVYEVDDLDLLKAKRMALKEAGYEPRVKVVDVGADVSQMEELGKVLLEMGFDPWLPTDWIGEGLFEYIEPSKHLAMFHGAKKYGGAVGSRFMLFLGDPFCDEFVRSLLEVNLPWVELRPIPHVIRDLADAGWSPVHILGEDDFMNMFKRAVTLPVFLVLVDAEEDAIATGSAEL